MSQFDWSCLATFLILMLHPNTMFIVSFWLKIHTVGCVSLLVLFTGASTVDFLCVCASLLL